MDWNRDTKKKKGYPFHISMEVNVEEIIVDLKKKAYDNWLPYSPYLDDKILGDIKVVITPELWDNINKRMSQAKFRLTPGGNLVRQEDDIPSKVSDVAILENWQKLEGYFETNSRELHGGC